MKMKKALALCLAAVLVILCCGCEKAPQTAPEYAARMQEELTKTPCTQMTMTMDMTVGIDMGPLGVFDMVMGTTTTATASQDPVNGYTESTVTMDVAGQAVETNSTGYTVEEEGEVVTYTETAGTWLRVPTGQSMEEWSATLSEVQFDPENIAFAEEVGDWDPEQLVCLTTQIAGEELADALDELIGSLTETMGTSTDMDALDFSVLTCDVRLFVDKKTYLPRRHEMTVSGMDELMNQVFSRMAVTVEVKEYSAVTEYLSFEKQEVPQLPEGVREKASVWTRLYEGNNDNGDGTYAIGEGMALVNVVPPEGFELAENGYDHLTFRRDDHRMVEYTMLYGDPAVFVATLDAQEAFNKEHGAIVSREQMELAGEHFDFTCEVIGNQWTSYEEGQMFAWTHLGNDGVEDFWLMVSVNDGYNDGLGGVKTADITPEEFMAYLNAATKSPLMD